MSGCLTSSEAVESLNACTMRLPWLRNEKIPSRNCGARGRGAAATDWTRKSRPGARPASSCAASSRARGSESFRIQGCAQVGRYAGAVVYRAAEVAGKRRSAFRPVFLCSVASFIVRSLSYRESMMCSPPRRQEQRRREGGDPDVRTDSSRDHARGQEARATADQEVGVLKPWRRRLIAPSSRHPWRGSRL